jgi:small subunit ribosomal protein S9
MEVIHTIGRRKTSVARLYVSKGKGAITVNKKNYTEFFSDCHTAIQNHPTPRID